MAKETAKLDVKILPSIMLHTGDDAVTNAESLQARDETAYSTAIGSLKKLSSGNYVWTKYPSYIFVENDTVIKTQSDIISNAYTYISNADYGIEYKGTPYMLASYLNTIYSYETDLNSSIVNAVAYPNDDARTFVAGLNMSTFNKQKYYNGEPEVDTLIFEGLRWKWYGYNAAVTDTYTGEQYNVSNSFIRYTYDEIEADKLEQYPYLDTYTYSYIIDESTGATYTYSYQYDVIGWRPVIDEKTQSPVTYTAIHVTGVQSLYDTINNRIAANIDDFKAAYSFADEPIYAYYISNADMRLDFIMDTYTLNSKKTSLYINYDSEYNDWFENGVQFNIDTANADDDQALVKVTAGDDYIFSVRTAYNDVSDGNVTLTAGDTHMFTLTDAETAKTGMAVLSPYKAKELDFSTVSHLLRNEIDLDHHYDKRINKDVTVDTTWHEARGNVLERLIIGKDKNTECAIVDVQGLSYMSALKEINIEGCSHLQNTPDIAALSYLSVFKAAGSNIDNFTPAEGITLSEVTLPNTVKSLKLVDCAMGADAIFDFMPSSALVNIYIDNAKHKINKNAIDTYGIVKNWIEALREDGTIDSSLVHNIYLKGMEWDNADCDILLDLKEKLDIQCLEGTIVVKGTGADGSLLRSEYNALVDAFGDGVFTDRYSALKFQYTFDPGAFTITVTMPENTVDNKNKPVVIEHVFTGTLRPSQASNAFLDSMYINDIAIASYKNIRNHVSGICFDLPNAFIATSTARMSNISKGDILLYKGKTVVIFTKDIADNPVNNYIYLGKVDDNIIDGVSILDTLNRIAEENVITLGTITTADIKDNNVKYLDAITLSLKNEDDTYTELVNEQTLTIKVPYLTANVEYDLHIDIAPEEAANTNVSCESSSELMTIDYDAETRDAHVSIDVSKSTLTTAILTVTADDNSGTMASCTFAITRQ